MAEYRVPAHLSQTFFDRIRQILGKPEKLRGDRSTTVFYASAVIDGEEVSARSSELPETELAEIANDPSTNAELRRKISAALDSGYHNWAHELVQATEAFVASCRQDTDT